MKHPKKIPISCSLRFTPKPLSRNYGKPRMGCNFVGGPWAGNGVWTRTGPILPVKLPGGCYVPDSVKDRMVWSPA